MINQILISANIFDLKNNLIKFINQESLAQKDFKKLYEKIENQCARFLAFNNEKWFFTKSKFSCMYYLYENWSFKNRAIYNKQELQKIIAEIEDTFVPATTDVWNSNTVTTIMSFLDNSYNFNNIVIKDHDLKLLSLGCHHKNFNSFIRCYETNGIGYGDIYLTEPNEWCKDTPALILLHELGHLVNIHLTGDVNVVPQSFVDAFKDDFIDLTIDNSNELFANCFAMAVLSNKELSEYDLFKDLHHNLKLKLDLYFRIALNPELLKGVINEI